MMRRVMSTTLAVLVLWPTVVAAQATVRPHGHGPAGPRATVEERATTPETTSRIAATGAPASGDRGVPDYQFSGTAQDRSLLWDGARMVLSLAVVLMLLGVGVKVVRRWPGFAARETAAGPLQVLGRLPLTAKEAVCLVRAGNDVLVVGVGPAGVNLLHRLDGGAAAGLPIGATATIARGNQSGERLTGGRLRELAARIRDVQAAWGLVSSEPKDRR
jgi:flagellar biogenesis protein FliO